MYSKKPFFLALAVVAILVTSVTNTSPKSSKSSKGRGIEGSWLITATFVGDQAPPPILNLGTFNRHGGLTGVNNDGAGIAGEWRKTGNRRVAVTFMLLTLDPNFGGFVRFKVRVDIRLNKKGDRWSGVFKSEAFNQDIPDGVFLFETQGTVQAERIRVEPL